MKRGLYQDLNKPCLTITSHLAKTSLNSRDPVLLVNPEKNFIEDLHQEKRLEFSLFLIILSFLLVILKPIDK